MGRKNNQGSIITLLLVIVAIVILHVLRDLRENDNRQRPVDDAALTGGITRY